MNSLQNWTTLLKKAEAHLREKPLPLKSQKGNSEEFWNGGGGRQIVTYFQISGIFKPFFWGGGRKSFWNNLTTPFY